MSKQKIVINSILGSVIWESEKDTLKEAVVEKNNRNANLRNADLRNANLRNADLRNANLRNANLRNADLRNANLRNADLRNADLRNADLYGADLYGANLRNADLYGADLYGADLYGADLYGANLYGADLYGANLRNADLWQLPTDYINQASRDILFIFEKLKSELPYFKEKLLGGEIDGISYRGDCSCLVGTLGHGDNEKVNKVCTEFIPFYIRGTHNAGEDWFLKIRKGDTPKNNQFSAHVLALINMVESGQYHTITYKPTDEQLKEFEEKRKELVANMNQQIQ